MTELGRGDAFAHQSYDLAAAARPRTAASPDVAPIDTLQVVFKIAERCNIDCSYCYYFNMGERSALERPPFVSIARAQSIASWLAQGCRDLAIPKVLVSFHGGEPMMLKPRVFDAVCGSLRDAIEPHASLGFVMQTNGTILSDVWLRLLREHTVHIGVSIDGDRRAHDRFRFDKRGRSTFDTVSGNLRRLVEWGAADSRLGPSTISVLDWRNDYTEIYKYFRSLGVRDMSYLLPDRSIDDGFADESENATLYGKALSDIFQAWLTEDNPNVFVRQIDNAMRHFQIAAPRDPSAGRETNTSAPHSGKRIQVLVVHSDGTVSVNDSFMPALAWYSTLPRQTVESCTLREFLSQPALAGIDTIGLPAACRSCRWAGLCGGGDLENRFSRRNGFENPSLYCDGYKMFFGRACDLLIENGYPAALLETRLRETAARRR